MVRNIPYHSALAAGKQEEAPPLTGVHTERGNSVFVWDMNDRKIPAQYYYCDLIYAEPSWPAGLKNFDARADATPHAFSSYAGAFCHAMLELNKPTVMFVGKTALTYLPPPDYTTEAMLNGNLTPVCFWNGAWALGASNQDIIKNLTESYDTVGDFCCGYGTTGRIFAEAGKNFVMSDYNATCCGYIKEHMADWK